MSPDYKPIIFTNPVSDLTMARYLAAMEVEFFGIDLDEKDEQKTKTLIQQIQHWVEGPQLIGVSANPSKNITEVFPLNGYYLDLPMAYPNDSIVFASRHYFLNHPETQSDYIIIENPLDSISSRKCILKSDIDVDPIIHLDISGYMITVRKEEKIGLYDFEKLDEWFGKIGR